MLNLFAMNSSNYRVWASFSFDKDSGYVEPHDPDAEDCQPTEHPHRDHHRNPALQDRSGQSKDHQTGSDEHGHQENEQSYEEHREQRDLAERSYAVQQRCETMGPCIASRSLRPFRELDSFLSESGDDP